MNCRQTQDLLSPYLDGELSADAIAAVEDHLQSCQMCAREFADVGRVSQAVRGLTDPDPPKGMWRSLENGLEGVRVAAWRRTPTARVIGAVGAVAAAVVLAVILIRPTPTSHRGHSPMAQRFHRFVQEFAEHPELAQRELMAEYQGRALDAASLAQAVSFTPAALRSPPNGYAVAGAYVLEMPCCQCTQTVLRRQDGRQIAIFEHNTSEQPNWFGDCLCVQTQCRGNACALAQVGNHLAASCQVKGRHYTIVGATDMDEVETVIAWLDQDDAGQRSPKEKT